MSPTARRSDYAVSIDRVGRLSVEGGAPVQPAEGWTPEHLVLAALAWCSIASLAYHARRASLDLVASATATGGVAPREDGVYAFVEVECRVDAELDPLPPGEELRALLVKAERGCFVGSSLTAKPRYRWRVNGEEASAT